jgi:predicted phage-related endonuclease
VAALYGVSPYMTAYELWHIKHGNIEAADLSDNLFIRFGKIVEPAIVKMIEFEKPDWKIEDCNVYAFDDAGRIGSSFDRFITIDGRKGLLELKSSSYSEYKKKYNDNEAPIHYEIQMQVQLELMPEAEFIMHAVFLADTRQIEYIRRERDADMGKAMREAVLEFWNGGEPAPDYARDKSILARLCPSANPDITLDATKNAKITELAAIYTAEKALEKQSADNADKAYAELMHLIGDARYVWTDHHKVTVSDIQASNGTLVTSSMVDTYINPRKAYKKLTIKETK